MIRGLWTHAGVLYSVEDGFLYSYDSASLKTQLGALQSIGGVVDFDSTLSQLCVNDGTHLYLYNPTLATFASVVNYPGGDRISFLAERINFLFRGTQQFGWTAAGDASIIDPLDFFSAESSPDLVVSQLAFQNELWIAGQYSIEIWDPTTQTDSGGNALVYEKSSASIDFGCAAPHSLQKTPNAPYWLGRDKNGSAMVLMGAGHQARRISTRYEEERFASVTDLSQARAFCYTDGGQSYYVLNVPGLDSTLVWDETFQQWHERAEWLAAGNPSGYSPWSPTCHAFAYGKHYFGCGNVLAISDRTVNTYLGNPKRRQRIAPVIADATFSRHGFPLFEAICEKATAAELMLRWSDDDGYTWSSTHRRNTGAQGKYGSRVRWKQLGNSRQRVFDISTADDAPFNPVMVNIEIT